MKGKYFPYIIALSALLVSGSAAFYSVYGIGKLFVGASVQVMVMAGSLEFAKIVIASLLQQYWDSINKILRVYFMSAVLVLIMITSAGIYGFLSSAYQETAFKIENGNRSIELIQAQKKIINSEIELLKKQIGDKSERIQTLSGIRSKQQGTQDNLIEKNKSTSSLKSQIGGVESNIKSLDLELKTLNDSLSSKNKLYFEKETEILNIKSNKDVAKEIGPIKYISELTGKSLATVVNWYIIALMLVFDPLAIALVIAANFAFGKALEDKDNISNKKIKETEEKIDPYKIHGFWEKPEKDNEIEGVIIDDIAQEYEDLTENADEKNIEEITELEGLMDEVESTHKNEYIKNRKFFGYRNIETEKDPIKGEDPTKLR